MPTDPLASRLLPDGTTHELITNDDGRALARYLLSSQRTTPVVVITIPPHAAAALVPADGVADDLKDVAPVVLLHPDGTFGLTSGLGHRTLSVFFGAARIYPSGTDWVEDMHRAPLMFVHSRMQGASVAKRLVSEAVNFAHAGGSLLLPKVQPADIRTDATVEKSLSEMQALVRTDDGRQAIMHTVHLRTDLTAPLLVRRGQRLTGVLRPMGVFAEFIPDAVADDPRLRVRQSYDDGAVTLARVGSVSQSTAEVLLHPDVPLTLAGAHDDDLRRMVTVGEVVAVEVAWLDGDCLVALADDEEAADSISVLPGGPPWLTRHDIGRSAPAEDIAATVADDEPRDATAPMVTTNLSRDELATELDLALSMIEQLNSELAAAEARTAAAAAELQAAKSDLRKARRSARRGQALQVHSDPAEQLRFEVWLAYLTRFDEASRRQHPLPERYAIGPQFCDTLTSLEGISRAKVVDVIVETLTGLVKDIPGRELHQWREGDTGPQQSRHDGARAWRVSLQVNTAGARRLKFWRLSDGSIELDSVGVHDAGLL